MTFSTSDRGTHGYLASLARVLLVELPQRQFAPACGRYTNAAKDGPNQMPGLVDCDAGLFFDRV